MKLRIALALTAVGVAALMASCAAQQSLDDAARAACTDEGVQPGPAMDECIATTKETLRRAREYSPPPPPPPPKGRR